MKYDFKVGWLVGWIDCPELPLSNALNSWIYTGDMLDSVDWSIAPLYKIIL